MQENDWKKVDWTPLYKKKILDKYLLQNVPPSNKPVINTGGNSIVVKVKKINTNEMYALKIAFNNKNCTIFRDEVEMNEAIANLSVDKKCHPHIACMIDYGIEEFEIKFIDSNDVKTITSYCMVFPLLSQDAYSFFKLHSKAIPFKGKYGPNDNYTVEKIHTIMFENVYNYWRTGYMDDKKIEHIHSFVTSMLETLIWMSKNKIFHKDFKPGNVLVNTEKSPPQFYISDLGSSCIVDKHKYTVNCGLRTSRMLSTKRYCHPNVLHRFLANKRPFYNINFDLLDLWSLAISVYEIIFGIFPYSEEYNENYLQRDLLVDPYGVQQPAFTFENTLQIVKVQATVTRIPIEHTNYMVQLCNNPLLKCICKVFDKVFKHESVNAENILNEYNKCKTLKN